MTLDPLRKGRESFAQQAWADAHAMLSAADREAPLEPEDLEKLATAACLIGRDTEAEDLWARAHHDYLRRGDAPRAARSAFWLASGLLNRGERARSGGWLARARRVLDQCGAECVERGFLLLPDALGYIIQGDSARAYAAFCEAGEIGERYGDPDLVALARHSRGRALIRLGEVERGVGLLDEAMAAVEARAVSPLVVGEVYCSVIEGCLEIYDLRRAEEWTTTLSRWCEAQPDLVPYRGQCLVRRAEILQLHGAWAEAADAARRACERLTKGLGQPAAGSAFHRLGELHRLRGEFPEAEEAYRQASRWGRSPEPGLALLRLAQGQVDAAAAAIRRAVEEARDRRARAGLLPAHVEIMIAAGDLHAAHTASSELAEIAADLDAPLLHATAAQAQGSLLLAEGDAQAALEALRRAWAAWQEVGAPYESARVRFLIALCCEALGDRDAAELELDGARWVYEQLGAAPDLARPGPLYRHGRSGVPGGLTARELQVLRMVATGRTNRAIAAELCISERTVDRHVSNILSKLGLPSRSAATAYAYEHALL